MGKQTPLAFTVSVPRGPIKKEIRLPVKIGNPGDPVEKALKFEAIWDTGTTMSIISTAVLKRLKLTDVIDTIAVTTVEGKAKKGADSYFVDVWLPDSICFPDVQVVHQEKFASGDFLIGMDIIGEGDSCVTNFDGQTTLTFRWPSCCHFDFAKEIKKGTCP